MIRNFSNRISSLQPSAIREILKVTQDPSVISFAAGNPAPETFPAAEMAEISAEIFRKNPSVSLQYGISEGYAPLRRITEERIKTKFGIGREFDDLIITSGGQQAIELTAKILLNEGDVVICEEPSFIGALNAFRSYNAKLVGVPADSGGMDMDVLERTLRGNPNAKLIYVIPTFQNPSGGTMSLSRRQRLLELSGEYGVHILEDNPYFELRYGGEYVPPIKSMDENGRVIYAGSYSKIISPGIRVGFASAPKDIISKLTVAKQVSDVHTNLFFMMLVAEYLERYDIDAHIEKCRSVYSEKRDLMLEAVKSAMDIKIHPADGGIFLWCELPDGLDSTAFCLAAGAKKVAAVPGAAFMVDESKKTPCFRLNFSLPSNEQIVKGAALLGATYKEFLPEVRG